MRLYYWIHHTSDSESATGVQRVVRNLAAELAAAGHDVVPVQWCARREAVVRADARAVAGLGRHGGPDLRHVAEPDVPLHLSDADAGQLEGCWMILPEVPHVGGEGSPEPAVALDYARYHGLRTAAVFYDLIPLRRSGYEAMADAHARYAHALTAADLVLAISQDSADDLVRWWAETQQDDTLLPPVVALPLPEEVRGVPRATQAEDPPGPPVRFLSLGSIEPRKNQVATLEAFARLCARRPDLDLRFDVVGGIHPAVAVAVSDIVAREPRVQLHRFLPDADVHALVAAAHATVFTSLSEGYGLPIAESLWLGRPCLSSDHGSMAEIAAGGGCLLVPARDSDAIERALERLADDPALRLELAKQACTRVLRTWQDYAAEVVAALTPGSVTGRVIVLQGTGDEAPLRDELRAAGVAVREFAWHPRSRALIPSGADAGAAPRIGAGAVHGQWAVLPQSSCADADEASQIMRTASGLGMRVALEVTSAPLPELLAQADSVLLTDEEAREQALALALRELPKTVAVRGKLQIGTGAAALRVLADSRSRLATPGPLRPPQRIYYWAGLTASQPFNTGVQRVTRLLAAALQRAGVEVVPVGWDDTEGRMVALHGDALQNLARWNGPRVVPSRPLPESLQGEWLLLPEITVPVVPPGSDVASLARSLGMRCAAVFHDLIPHKLPELYPAGAVDNMRSFWRTFASVDVALPNSWTTAADLHRYVTEQGWRLPRIVPCPLAADPGGAPRAAEAADRAPADGPLRLLAVGTWEPRKNYPRLLRAFTAARAASERPLHLTIVGRRAGYADFDVQVQSLADRAGVELRDHVDDDELRRLYEQADVSVFASWEEGFGLPVVESLWRGRPCLAHDGSAMAELAPGGGVLAVDMLDERSIEQAIVRLANERGLLERLSDEAVSRPLRTWDEYAQDVLRALSRSAAAPGWPLPAVVRRRPLLSCCITTYNRAPWLRHSLPRLLEATRPWRDVVEVVVCDNASTDDTPDVLAGFQGERGFRTARNAVNVGMLGNLGATAQLSRGAFVWLLGDDDLLIDGAVENVLEGLAAHPDVEMAYMNYSFTSFDGPKRLADVAQVMATATPIAEDGVNRRVDALRDVAALNENLFTAIYACAFRRDHALRAYQLDTRGTPFSSLKTCVPSSVYALSALQDRPAWWVGEPAVVVNMNVSWLRWALLWHLERMPDLYEEAERCGIDGDALDPYRAKHVVEAGEWVRATYFDAEDAIRENFSLARLLERCKHLPEFRRHLPEIRRTYDRAWAAGRVLADDRPGQELLARYGL